MILKQKQRYLENLESHIKSSEKASEYSIERFDILVISLASGGLVLSIAFVKDLIPNYIEINLILLKLSWALFGATPIINLLSQVSGYYSNVFAIDVSRNKIRRERGKAVKVNIEKLEKKCQKLNFITMLFNGLCLFTLMAAIILLIVFIFIYV